MSKKTYKTRAKDRGKETISVILPQDFVEQIDRDRAALGVAGTRNAAIADALLLAWPHWVRAEQGKRAKFDQLLTAETP